MPFGMARRKLTISKAVLINRLLMRIKNTKNPHLKRRYLKLLSEIATSGN
jgi:hypothetical protein